MYQIIYDENELKRFYDNVMPRLIDDEVYFVSLSARNKYLTEEERKRLALGRTEMFAKTIVRSDSFARLLRTIRKYETNEGSYLTKNGSYIPPKSIICYFNINPSSTLKAYKEFNATMNEYMYELAHNSLENRNTENIISRIKRMDDLMMICYQKNRGRKVYLDVDFDINKGDFHLVEYFCERMKQNNVKYFVVDTKSGYHVLLDRSTIKFNFTEVITDVESKAFCIYGEREKYEIVLNKNAMIPLPGTLQGGHEVRVLYDE